MIHADDLGELYLKVAQNVGVISYIFLIPSQPSVTRGQAYNGVATTESAGDIARAIVAISGQKVEKNKLSTTLRNREKLNL